MSVTLQVENLEKSFGNLKVLKNVSFNLEKGKTMVVIGPSGSGKSTLLRCINQLTPPDNGRVVLNGVELTSNKINLNEARSEIGFVFQNFNLITHLNVLGNVSFGPLRVKGKSKKDSNDIAMEELKRVGLEDKTFSYPAELSGGQQQRVSIARALALKPKLILFDEPTSALDPELIGEVLDVITKLAKEGMTALIVTHEMGFARSIADEAIFLEGGIILEKGPPKDLFSNPKNKRTMDFLQKISQLYGKE